MQNTGGAMSTTIGKKLRAKLGDTAGQENITVDVSQDGVSVAVDAEGCDKYAAGVRDLRVRPSEAVSNVGDAAERVAQNVDVIDRLRVVEYDAPQQEAILRSEEPEADEVGITYWEATVKPDETTVQRYHKDHRQPDRDRIVEPLTHRDLGELADQIVDALHGETP